MIPKNGRKNFKGFTLIELLIVVAIIAIMTTMAFPMFTLVKAKSRRAEMFVALAGVYTSEMSYFTINNSYQHATCPPANCDCGVAGPIANWSHDFTLEGFNLSDPTNYYGICITVVTGALNSFTVEAGGDIDGDPCLDHGQITDGNREIFMVSDDITCS